MMCSHLFSILIFSLMILEIAATIRYDAFVEAEPLHPSLSPEDVLIAESPETQQDEDQVLSDWRSQSQSLNECGYTKMLKVGDVGTITSPQYPKNYPNKQQCEWNLESPLGTQIKVVIFDLSTKPWYFAYFDYVVLSRNGEFTDVEKLYGDLNGKTPMLYMSTSNKFGVRFISDTYHFHFRGFKLQYLVIPSVHDSSLRKPLFLDGVCGRSFKLKDRNKIISTAEKSKANFGNTRANAVKSVGGVATDAYSYPWMAALLIDDRNFCGGSLIDSEHILTAAHCTNSARRMSILLGSHNLKAPKQSEPGRIVFNVTRTAFLQHPDYNPRTLAHDISIIKLPVPVSFTNEIQPICLPNKYFIGEALDSRPVQVSGWGKTKDGGGKISSTLQHVLVSIIPNAECKKTFRGVMTGNKLCVETQKEHSPCKGDSGGPMMMVQDGPQGKFYMQFGIVSFGTNSCERGKPVGFTRVTAFLDFIAQTVGKSI